jgi:pyruvate dehydrogenase (quinone)
VPPLPPHIRVEQAKGLLSALRQGEPAAREIIRQSFRGKLQEFTTR